MFRDTTKVFFVNLQTTYTLLGHRNAPKICKIMPSLKKLPLYRITATAKSVSRFSHICIYASLLPLLQHVVTSCISKPQKLKLQWPLPIWCTYTTYSPINQSWCWGGCKGCTHVNSLIYRDFTGLLILFCALSDHKWSQEKYWTFL